MSPLLLTVWTTVPAEPALGSLTFLKVFPVKRKPSKPPAELMAYTVTSRLLLIDHAAALLSPGTSMLLNSPPARLTNPCWTPAESKYRPARSPLSLIPVASVPVPLGKLTSVNFPAADRGHPMGR